MISTINNEFLIYRCTGNDRDGETVKLIALRYEDSEYNALVYFYSTQSFEELPLYSFTLKDTPSKRLYD